MGTAPLYLANNIVKFTTSSKLTSDKEFGINGWHSKVSLIKSRSNRAGQEFGMVYNQEYGFSRELSVYQMLKENDMVRGSGAWFYLDGLPGVKFQQKQFMAKYYEEPMLREAMKELMICAGEQALSGVRDLGAYKNGIDSMDESEIDNALLNSLVMESDSIFA